MVCLSCRCCIAALVVLAGCGSKSTSFESPALERSRRTGEAYAREGAYERDIAASTARVTKEPAVHFEQVATRDPNRKMVYRSSFSLVVDDLVASTDRIAKLANEAGGFVSQRQSSQASRSRRIGSLTVRMPAGRYDDFLNKLSEVGYNESRRETARDVTEQYVDTEARIVNDKKLEQRILQMLQDRTGKLEDVLKIETELARIREQIERMEGRMRVLNDQIALATVEIQMREESTFVPPRAPSFVGRMDGALKHSTGGMMALFQNVVVVVVIVLPWALLILPIAYLIHRLYRNGRHVSSVK